MLKTSNCDNNALIILQEKIFKRNNYVFKCQENYFVYMKFIQKIITRVKHISRKAIKNEFSLNLFKRKLKEYLVEKVVYLL